MTWNFRVVRFKDEDQEGGYRHEFVEVFYNEDGSLMGYSDPYLYSETLEGMQELAARLSDAAANPVIDEEEFGELHDFEVEL